jgi:hypothetical protein
MVKTTPATLTQYYDGTSYNNFTTASPGATGTYPYIIRLSGYQDVTGSVTVTAGSTATISATFTGNASFSSNPTGAEIWVDGADTGHTTPYTITGLTATNNHTYILKKSGYADQTGTFSISSGATTSISVTFPGSAYLTSTPSGSRIYVDGTDTGHNTPYTIIGLTAGSHSYKLTLTGYTDYTGSFTTTDASTTTVDSTFTPSAYFTSSPSGASIYLDGGGTPIGTTPVTITNLSTGLHNYTLSLSGYSDYTGSFTSTAGSTSNITITFAGSANITSTPTGAQIFLAVSPNPPTDQFITTPSIITGLTTASPGATTLWNYKLTLSGYADTSGSFTATAGSTISVPVTFPGSASFSSNPTGAEIWIDGVDKGITTPSTVTGLSPTTHSYTLKLSGYKDTNGSFSVTSGTTAIVPLVTFQGNAYFTSTPTGARIYIDDADTGVNTPGTVTGLSAGSHSYKLRLSGYADFSGSLTATDASTISVSSIFTASAYLTSTPSGASIYLDGGLTPTGTTNATITNLTEGTHTYKLTLAGYTDYTTGSFSATAGSTVNVSATFAGSAYITSTPTGAEIFLAVSPGNPTDQVIITPQTITGLTTASSGATATWNYKLTKTGYADTSGSFTATAGSTISIPVTFSGSAYITSTPSGAEIYIDETDTTISTPGTVTGLSAGSHSYKLTLAGYTDVTGTFTATAGTTVDVPITFAASAYITSTPTGASIYLDGEGSPIGTTPDTLPGLSEGTHNYILTKTGYANYSGSFTATAGTTVSVPSTFAGSIYFTSIPSSTEIYLAASPGTPTDKGVATPNTIINATAASSGATTLYNYKLTLTGYQDVTGTVTATAGTTVNVTGTFTGNCSLSSTPSGAEIWIDDSDKGHVTPYTITGLSAGTHSYKLTLSGYEDATGNFSITSGSTTSLPVTFPGNVNVSSTPTGGRIYIDGADKGINTPNTVTGLSTGTHSYKLTLTGYADATGTFIATAGSTVDLPVTFPGSANITSTPTGAEIYLALSPASPTDQSVATPRTITNLTESSSGATSVYNYLLRLYGYADTPGTFTATAGTTVEVPVTFPGSVYITSDPSGASIYLDDNLTSSGMTPGILTGLSSGSHTYTLKLSGFADVSGSFTIVSGETVDVSKTFLGSLEISSNPSGAEIYIDGTDKGIKTSIIPTTIITGLTAGTHSFKLTYPGFADVAGTFPIVDAETTILSETFLGNLDIGSIPTGATIYLDGSLTSIGTTPSTIMGLLPGSHDIKLTLTNYYDYFGTATATDAITTPVNITLTPKFGSINIKSTPRGSNIYIDDSQTPIGITNSPTWTIISNVSVGSHTFKLSHVDYGDVTGTFDIYPNQITQITAVLDPIPEVPHSYGVWDPSGKARLKVYKCKKIDIEQYFLINLPTLSFDYQITADANPEIIRWQLVIGNSIVIDDVIPATSYGTSTGHITENLSAYLGMHGTIKFYVESGPDCEQTTHENTYLWLDNIILT